MCERVNFRDFLTDLPLLKRIQGSYITIKVHFPKLTITWDEYIHYWGKLR